MHRLFAPNIWPSALPDLRPALVSYMNAAKHVSYRLLTLLGLALGQQSSFFERYTSHSTITMRVNNYETAPDDGAPFDGQLGMGEHTDYGIITVLYADAVQGLQIVDPDGAWHDVVVQEGALLVNLGDLMARWTNDMWRSTIHRVMPPVRLPDKINKRRSVAFFVDGNFDAVIECLDTCTSASNPPKYPPVLAGLLAGSCTLSSDLAVDCMTD